MNHRTLQPLETAKVDNNGQHTIQRSATHSRTSGMTQRTPQTACQSPWISTSHELPQVVPARCQIPHLVKGSSQAALVIYQWNTFLTNLNVTI